MGRLKTKLYDKRYDFSFPFVHFPFLSCNILAAPAYGENISQLIRYSRACISYHDFLDRGLLLTSKLLNQEFQIVKLRSLFPSAKMLPLTATDTIKIQKDTSDLLGMKTFQL